MEIGIFTLLIMVVVALGLFFAPLFIWHHTAATAQILRRLEKKLDKMIIARDNELSGETENAKKAVHDINEPPYWDCPRCGAVNEIEKTMLSDGKLKCSACGQIVEVESKE